VSEKRTATSSKRRRAPRAAGVESPRREARLLLLMCWGSGRSRSFRKNFPSGRPVSWPFRSGSVRRAQREPLAYIIGAREFWSLDFESPSVLIPRRIRNHGEEALKRFPKPTPAARADSARLGLPASCLLSERAEAEGWVSTSPRRRLAAPNATDTVGLEGEPILRNDWINGLSGPGSHFINPPYMVEGDWMVWSLK